MRQRKRYWQTVFKEREKSIPIIRGTEVQNYRLLANRLGMKEERKRSSVSESE